MCRSVVAALAVIGLTAVTGRAQSQSDPLETSALAIAAYEASEERCFYSPGIGAALAQIDAILTRRRPAEWEQIKPTGEEALAGLRNRARILGAESDCATYGTAVGYVLPVAFGSVDLDNSVVEELSRLLSGAGRSISGETEARPPQPTAPGSAADTIMRLNGDRGFDNTPAAQPPQSSTLKRLPADDPPSTSLRSQPPRQSANPPPRRERTPPAPLVQAAPSVSLPPASPNLASPPAVPPASSSPDCRVAGDCRLAQATFACNLDDAARIAGVGPDAGREAGLAAVRAGTCEIVAAGRSLKIEATKASNVVYATEQGRHVGYLPVGVFAPVDQAGTTACRAPGFCAVRRGPPIWLCRQADSLALPTSEAKRAAGCLQIADSAALEVATAQGDAVALLNMVGGSPVVPTLYFAARSDFVGLDLTPTPTPASRGWCRPGDWCVIPMGSVFCPDGLAYERIMSQTGDARRAAILAEPACRLMVPGNVLKPGGVAAADDPRKLITVEHPVLKSGWASANAFKVVAYNPPLRYTPQLSDLVVSAAKSPSFVAVALSAQGTSEASGTFRAGPRERLAFCKDHWGEESPSAFRSCLDEPDETLSAKADCGAKRVSLDGRRYELRERPGDVPAGSHTDPTRHWLYRDLASGDWLDGTTVSGEATVGTTFNALCPGTDPEAASGLVYRDSRAQFPHELQGRWYDDRRACGDPRRTQPDYDEHVWMMISERERRGNREFEFPQRINAVRRIGPQSWQIDGSHRIDSQEVPEIFGSTTYALTRDSLMLAREGVTSKWVKCQ